MAIRTAGSNAARPGKSWPATPVALLKVLQEYALAASACEMVNESGKEIFAQIAFRKPILPVHGTANLWQCLGS